MDGGVRKMLRNTPFCGQGITGTGEVQAWYLNYVLYIVII